MSLGDRVDQIGHVSIVGWRGQDGQIGWGGQGVGVVSSVGQGGQSDI